MNHHQKPFCDGLAKRIGEGFVFIATEPVSKERIKLGYQDLNKVCPYVVRAYESQESLDLSFQKVIDADFVLVGSAPYVYLKLLKKNSHVYFQESERFFKGRINPFIKFLKRLKYKFRFGCYKKAYLLTLSSYTYSDALSFWSFNNRSLKFGYFPATRRYPNFSEFYSNKKANTILWVGRFIGWKHPELMLDLARHIKNKGLNFKITMMGSGVLFDQIKNETEQQGLDDIIALKEARSPEEVRNEMELAQYYCFTSDSNEGWGAVANEAMNSGCILITNDQIGTTGFLCKDGQNAFIYSKTKESFIEAFDRARQSLKQKEISENAYKTIAEEWNAEIAAERFLTFLKTFDGKNFNMNLYDSGIMSKN